MKSNNLLVQKYLIKWRDQMYDFFYICDVIFQYHIIKVVYAIVLTCNYQLLLNETHI